MEIGRQFNQLNSEEYHFYIDNHKSFKDFNTLGLYRSLVENNKLSLEDKIAIREHAHTFFKKIFDFLQLKDPETFVKVSTLGQHLTKADKDKIWNEVIKNQQKILKEKEISHRNFGVYSKHSCGYDDCIYNGLMIRQNSGLCERSMHFDSDSINKYQQKQKAKRRKSERKKEKLMIKEELTD